MVVCHLVLGFPVVNVQQRMMYWLAWTKEQALLKVKLQRAQCVSGGRWGDITT